ncbi:MAG: DUF2399 domain-containing protein [Candidatus Hatepunaea meridiana]|nr:DUF2399 domain-containing protein [Candidatus Hatepunaea meridiana]
MNNAESMQRQFQRAIATAPGIMSILVKLTKRIERNHGLKGRMKLGNRLSEELKSALLMILPNVALDFRITDDVILRIDRIVTSDEEADDWVSALQNTLRYYDPQNENDNILTAPDLRKITDRGRLLFSDLNSCWQAIDNKPEEYIRLMCSKKVDKAQDELFTIAETVRWLRSDHNPIGLMDLSARFFNDSKLLKTRNSLVKLLQDWLILLRNGDADASDNENLSESVLAEYGVFENVTSSKVTLFGPLKYIKRGKIHDWPASLSEIGESATLSWDNLRDIEQIILPENSAVVSCENETPFNQLIREHYTGLIIYTAGYPNTAVQLLFQLLADSTVKIQHWGDSDLDGLIIASILHKISPLILWRCNIDELYKQQDRLLRLTASQKARTETYLANHTDFPFLDELQFTLQFGWLEQESWLPINDVD